MWSVAIPKLHFTFRVKASSNFGAMSKFSPRFGKDLHKADKFKLRLVCRALRENYAFAPILGSLEFPGAFRIRMAVKARKSSLTSVLPLSANIYEVH
jgi:hypothetical protein